MSGFHFYTIKETAEKLNTDIQKGLTQREAQRRVEKIGKNILEEEEEKGIIKKLAGQLSDFMIIVLLLSAVVSFIGGAIAGNGDMSEPMIILAIVIINAGVGVFQESRAEKSLKMLKRMSAPTARVLREGKITKIPAWQVALGDILILEAGDIVAADGRLVQSCEFFTDESSVTGESVSVEKNHEVICDSSAQTGDRKNCVLASTLVTGGHGRAIVTGVGMDTEVGRVANLIIREETPKTPMQNRMAGLGKKMGIGALVICGLVFVIGVLKGYKASEMFITSVSLAVAAIPEGLPAIVTVMLAMGVARLAKRGALIRHLPSVETLGSARVICTDKTGTLTENKMSVSEIYTEDKELLCSFGRMCSAEEIHNPTEAAIIEYVEKNIGNKINGKRLKEIPFSSETKKMTVFYRLDGQNKMISKGAPDILFPQCTKIREGDGVNVLTAAKRRKIEKKIKEMAEKALRVVAVVYKNCNGTDTDDENMVFLGLFGIEDKVRSEAESAVKICKNAGIIPVMVTGDYMETALAVAKKTGIYEEGKKTATGSEIEKMSDTELEQSIDEYRIFARVTPEHKLRIVKAWRKKGMLTAMTGDGVNDAPALKCADIGCSLGKCGTEVARAASDMILTDDNFATITEAVRCGRLIYENIRKTVKFLLSSNIGEIFAIFCGMLLGFPPLRAIQLLWINLITDSLPAIALGVDPENGDIMKKSPSDEKFFSMSDMVSIALEGMMIGSLALVAYAFGRNTSESCAGTMAFSVLGLSQLVHAFNMRSEQSVLGKSFFKNKMLTVSAIVGAALQVAVVEVPIGAKLFKTEHLSTQNWLLVIILSLIPLIVVELQKLFNKKIHEKSKKNKNTIYKS